MSNIERIQPGLSRIRCAGSTIDVRHPANVMIASAREVPGDLVRSVAIVWSLATCLVTMPCSHPARATGQAPGIPSNTPQGPARKGKGGKIKRW